MEARKVAKFPSEVIEKYQEILRHDPSSKVFAALADACRERGLLPEAEAVARSGIEKNPRYVGGYVALARILNEQKRYTESLPLLNEAIQLSPENLLAYQLLGQAYVELKKPTEALKAHKMALFLNPLSERSRKAVEKLETLTAVDFEDDLFEMKPLPKALETLHGEEVSVKKPLLPEEAARKRDRQLSLIDALVVRNEVGKAQALSEELYRAFPEDPEVLKRWNLLGSDEGEEPTAIRPLLSREKAVLDRQITSLRKILKRLQEIRAVGPEFPAGG